MTFYSGDGWQPGSIPIETLRQRMGQLKELMAERGRDFSQLSISMLGDPNEIPIAGEPANVVAAVEEYNAKLQQSPLPKLLFSSTPGALITAPIVEWCQQNLSNLTVGDIGPGIHFVQEDNPHLIGTELANWYSSL